MGAYETLWEGRFKSCLMDTGRYALTVQRYIELNPVRAAMAEAPETYRWSSARASLGLLEDPMLSFHPVYMALGSDPATRALIYRQWLFQDIELEDGQAIRAYLQQERALGSPRFRAMVEKTLNRPVAMRGPGRPRSSKVDGPTEPSALLA